MERFKKYTIITTVVLFVFFAGLIAGIVAVSRYLETEDVKVVASGETVGSWGVPRLEDENTPEITRFPEETYPKAPETTKSPEEAPSKNMESNDNDDPGRLVVPEAREIPFI